MKVLLLIPDRKLPSARYRVLQYAGHLETAGVKTRIEAIPAGWFARRRILRIGAEFDSVLLQKRLLRPRQAACLRRHARRLVYDFDDAMLYHNSSKRKPESGTRRRRLEAIMKLADLVIAGNDHLHRMAQQFGAQAIVIPTVLDPTKYDRAAAARKPDSDTVTLGWIGSTSTVEHIAAIGAALTKVAVAHPTVRLKLICDSFPEIDGIAMEKQPWSDAAEADDVASLDIGLAPCNDTPWTRGKCGLKILQYLAASKPVVCSPVGVQKEMVQDGVNGYQANNLDEWANALGRLITSAKDRTLMGAAGRRILQEHYTLERWSPCFVEAVTGSPQGQA